MTQQREIKFRAWNIHGKCMVAPETVAEEFLWISDTPKSYALMQFTGLYDKAGTAIYESDILDNGEGYRVEVIFSEGAFGFMTTPPKGLEDTFKSRFASLSEWGTKGSEFFVKVIGNIYEHKELLS